MEDGSKSFLLHDMLSVRSVKYWVLAFSSGIQFVRQSSGDSFEVILQNNYELTGRDSLAVFLRKIIFSNCFYGQPISILLNNEHCFSYLRRCESTSVSKLGSSLQSLDTENTDVTFHTKLQRAKMLAFLQGVNREYLEEALSTIERCRIRVISLTTLPVLIASASDIPDSGKQQSYRVNLSPDDQFLLSYTSSGDVVIGSNRDQLADTEDEEIKTLGLSMLLKRAAADSRFWKNSACDQKYLQRGVWSSRAFSICKLLTSVLLMAQLAIVIILSILALSSPSTEAIPEYQERYTQVMRVEQQVDSLQTELQKRTDNAPTGVSVAACLSLFCQKRYRNLYLDRLRIRNVMPDTAIIEARGLATSEPPVFDLVKLLRDVVAPLSVRLNSVRPETQRNGRAIDTLYRFEIMVSTHEDQL